MFLKQNTIDRPKGHVSSRVMDISSPDLCTLHLRPLYDLEVVIEEVSRNRY